MLICCLVSVHAIFFYVILYSILHQKSINNITCHSGIMCKILVDGPKKNGRSWRFFGLLRLFYILGKYPAGMLLLQNPLAFSFSCFHIRNCPGKLTYITRAANHAQRVETGTAGHGRSVDPTPYIVLCSGLHANRQGSLAGLGRRRTSKDIIIVRQTLLVFSKGEGRE